MQVKKIDPFVGELLFDHDCVIITDLGGFVASYRAPGLNPALHVLTPSSKRIAFNGSLKINDGLLANHIASRTGMTYPEACDTIRDYVNEAFHNFESGKRIAIEKVGVLYQDGQKNIQFQPDTQANFLTESFGLTPVHMPAIKRDQPVTGSESAVVRPFAIPARKTGKRRIGVLEMIPAAAVLAIMFITPPALDQFNTQLGKMLPFSRINEYIHEFTGSEEVRKPSMNIVLPSPFLIPPRSHSQSVADTTKKQMEPAAMPQPAVTTAPPAVHETSSVFPFGTTQTNTIKEYHVIGGCFKSLVNAENFISEMQSKGIEARMIGKAESGLFMVSLYHSDSRPEAVLKLVDLKTVRPDGAWIYPVK
jgi:hypothetical protein